MKTKLIQIGNSRGIRLPKSLIEHMKINGDVDLEIRGDELILRASVKPSPKVRKPKDPRTGWAKAFKDWIAKNGPIPALSSEEKAFLEMPNALTKDEETAW